MKRIHIVGSGPRTGTTLLAEMMIACFEIDLHTAHEEDHWRPPSRNGTVYLTKRPRDILLVEPALRLVRNLHVIYMIRDPRDAIVSRHGRDRDNYWAGLNYWKTYTPHGRRLRAHPRFVTIRYEDLVSEPDKVQKVLMERMPFLRKRAAFSQYHELASPSKDSIDALGSVRPPTTGSIGNWRRHLARVAGQVELHGSITADLIEYGYETDDSWTKELAGVVPDLRPSHLGESLSRPLLRRIKVTRHLKAFLLLLGIYSPTAAVLRLFTRKTKIG